MASKPKKTAAKSWLDVAQEQRFWVNDGQVLKNLSELLPALRKMSKETFLHHVNAEKNDFANWLEHVYCEKEIAKEVRQTRSKTALMRAIQAHLE